MSLFCYQVTGKEKEKEKELCPSVIDSQCRVQLFF